MGQRKERTGPLLGERELNRAAKDVRDVWPEDRVPGTGVIAAGVDVVTVVSMAGASIVLTASLLCGTNVGIL